MKKKIILTIIIIIILLILFIPMPIYLKDGGTVEYKSLIYEVSNVHRLSLTSETGYEDGIIIKIFGIEIYNNVNKNISNFGGNMKKEEYIKTCFERLNLLGITVDEKEQQEIINNINLMPQDMLNDLDNYQVLGLILDDLGMPKENEDNDLSIYSFDVEVFELDTMYTDFLNYINILTNDELKIEVIKEDTSGVNYEEGTGIQIIDFKMLDKEYSFEAKVNNDWFDVKIISYLNEIIKINNSNKFLYIASDGWQNCILFYNTDKWAQKFNELFPESHVEKI